MASTEHARRLAEAERTFQTSLQDLTPQATRMRLKAMVAKAPIHRKAPGVYEHERTIDPYVQALARRELERVELSDRIKTAAVEYERLKRMPDVHVPGNPNNNTERRARLQELEEEVATLRGNFDHVSGDGGKLILSQGIEAATRLYSQQDADAVDVARAYEDAEALASEGRPTGPISARAADIAAAIRARRGPDPVGDL